MKSSRFLLLAILLTVLPLAAASPPPEPQEREQQLARPADAVLEKIRTQAQRSPTPYDEPDAAARLYALERLPADERVDPVRLYAAARRHMEKMPRYASRYRIFLPSLAQAGPDPMLKAATAQLGRWEPLGPGNIGGRTRALLIDPQRPRIRYAGGVSGGIWKTEDNGRHWLPVGDLIPNIAVNSLAMDPTDPDVLYAGTGEGYFREVIRGTDLPLRGAGIFKSVDGGESWEHLTSTWNHDFRWVNKIVISPHHHRRLYAATRTGIWRSSNGGKSWVRILDPELLGGCLDLAIRTDRQTDVLFASCGTLEQATVYRSENAAAGRQWTPVLTEEGMGRTSLAIAPSNQEILYALAASYLPGPQGRFEHGLHAVFRSDRGGAAGTWQAVVRNTDPVKLNTLILSNSLAAHLVACGLGNEDFYLTLGWYTNVIAVDPTDPDVVWAGGVDLYRSDDGGHNWGLVSYAWESPPSAHADQHVIVFHPDYDGAGNQTLLLGGDGGVWRTPNARAAKATGAQAPCSRTNSAVRWASLNHNYGVTQFYHGTPFPDGRRYFGGTQDNGTILGSDEAGMDGWVEILGGDGGYVAVDPDDPEVLYAETQSRSFYKSYNGGQSFRQMIDGISEPRESFLFIPPLIMDPNDSRRLWTGGRSLWRTTNGAVSWAAASLPLGATAKVSAIAVAPGDSDRVVVGLSDGTIHRSDHALSTNAASEWPASRARAGGWVSWLAFDPHDADLVYATYTTFGGKHVFKSLDGGASWQQIDGNGPRRLPNLPVHSIAVDPTDSQRLFVGTDLGVFVSTTGGRRWAVENTGFAHAVTESLAIVTRPNGRTLLFAFTHGRGAWRVEL